MKTTITKVENNLEIKLVVPYKSQRFNPYDDTEKSEMDNIVGVIAGDKIGFANWIDMAYKGKGDQISDLFYQFQGDKKEFKKICQELDIYIQEYHICSKCGKVLYGTFTIGDKGNECLKHSDN